MALKILKKSGYVIETLFNDKVIATTDIPDENGNKKFATPGELATAATACCALSVINMIANENGHAIEGAYAETSQEYDNKNNRISKICIDFHLPQSTPHPLREKIKNQTEEECTVSRSLREDIKKEFLFFYDI